jgi:hypothetical protein
MQSCAFGSEAFRELKGPDKQPGPLRPLRPKVCPRILVAGPEPGAIIMVDLIVVAITLAFCAVMAIAALRVVTWWERHYSDAPRSSKAPLDPSPGESANLAEKESPRINPRRDVGTE